MGSYDDGPHSKLAVYDDKQTLISVFSVPSVLKSFE